jgi:hypothetical protein
VATFIPHVIKIIVSGLAFPEPRVPGNVPEPAATRRPTAKENGYV